MRKKKSIDEEKKKKKKKEKKQNGAEGGMGRSEMEKELKRNGENGKMESRGGGNVTLQFTLEEQLLPRLADGHQLPRGAERRGEVKGGRGRQIGGGLAV